MVGVGCFAAKTKKYNRKPFFKDNTGNKKTGLYCLLTMIKDGWVRKNKNKRLRTLIICPVRKNSEKRYKKEDVTISISNKKKLPGTFAKVCVWQSGQTFHGTLGTFSTLGTLATFQNVSGVFNVHLIYIYRYFADKQLLFSIVNTFIH